jgi:hypothetical protein
LFGVCLLDRVASDQSICIAGLCSLHGGWGRGQFGKDRMIVVLLTNIIPLKHNPAFIFAGGVVFLEFGAFLYADLEDSTYVDGHVLFAGVSRDISPLLHFRFIPTTSLPELPPFFQNGLKRGGIVGDFLFGY